MSTILRTVSRLLPSVALVMAGLAAPPASAAEFSVTPIRVELRPGAMSETIAVINHLPQRLRASVKLVEWTQDAAGTDVYKDSSDLIYFPRQLDVEGDGKRLLRVGAKGPAGGLERAYRLYIEEEPQPVPAGGTAQVQLRFRFGVPIFLPPPGAKAIPEVQEPTLAAGKLAVVVRNTGNAHFRLVRIAVSDGASFTREIAGWYSLARTERTYAIDIPAESCRRARTLHLTLEGDGLKVERTLNVDPARCA